MGDRDELEQQYAEATALGRLSQQLAEDLLPAFRAFSEDQQRELAAALDEAPSRNDVDYERVLGNALIPLWAVTARDFFVLVQKAVFAPR